MSKTPTTHACSSPARAHLVVCQLHSRHHEYSTVTGLPVVITNETALGGRALVFGQFRHTEADVGWSIEWCRIQYRDTIPACLHLYGEMHLETFRGLGVMEDGVERCILQRRTVDITGHPIVIEDRRTLGSSLS